MRWIFDGPNGNIYRHGDGDGNSDCDCNCNSHIHQHGDEIPYLDKNHFADQNTCTYEYKGSDPKTCEHSHPYAYAHKNRRTRQTRSDKDPDAPTVG